MTIDLNQASRQIEDVERRKERIKADCENRIRQVVRHLYPRAVLSGNDARIGDVDGTPGGSMSIAIGSQATGQWIDHATGDRGDVLELWARALGVPFAEALHEAESWLGGSVTRRQIDHDARQSRIAPAPDYDWREVEAYPYQSATGETLFEVVREHAYLAGVPALREGGKPVKRVKPRTSYPPGLRPLYMLPVIDRADEVVLCEGENCANAVHACGWAATSAPGGSNTRLDAIDWRPLAGKRVILWPDNDDSGRAFMARVQSLLSEIGCSVTMLDVPADASAKWDAADASEDQIHALLKTGVSARPRIPILSISDLMHMEPPRWLVDGLLVENGLSVIYGPSESFKSFIALDIALSISCGSDWRGQACDGGPVVYVIGEGVAGWPARVLTWIERRSEGRTPDFWTVPVGIAMTEKDDASALLDAIQGVCERPAMIVLDTLARNFGAGDENSTQDMNAFIASVDRVRQATGAHVMLVHHTGKDAERGARGSSVLRAALDTEMQCERSDFNLPFVSFRVTKQKDIEKGEPMSFEMVSAEATHPVTGEIISSLFPVLTTARNDLPDLPDAIARQCQDVLEILKSGPKTIKDMMDKVSFGRTYLQSILRAMEERGQILVVSAGRQKIYEISVSATNGVADE